jgi:hypothetical protein
MTDPTEATRRAMLESDQPHRDLAAADRSWTTDELREEFEVHGFMAPFVVVTRKRDRVQGSLEFTHSPRRYFNFREDTDFLWPPLKKCHRNENNA